MEADHPNFVINRVVIALDSVCDYLAPIEAAADLALRLHAELHGVFVEDMGLLGVAELPFTRQVALGREPTRPLERDAIEAEFRAIARQARHCLERIAAARRIRWSFEVVKGDRAGYTPPATQDELLVLEGRTRAFAGHVRLRAPRQLPVPGWRATALLGPARTSTPSVVAIIDDSPASERALEAAFGLARDDLKSLTIFRPPGMAGHLPAQRGIPVGAPKIRDFADLGLERLRVILRETAPGIAIIALHLVQGRDEGLSSLLSDPPCTILLVA